MRCFDDPQLVAKYGSWVEVQVAFYDFIFGIGQGVHTACVNDMAVEEWAKGNDFYEVLTKNALSIWPTPEDAWMAFLKSQR